MITAVLALAVLTHEPGREVGIVWERNFELAQKKARGTNRPLMIDFWADWCAWCERLDRTTYLDPIVVKLAKDFVPVKVNTEGSPQDAAVALRFDVDSLPTIAFVSPAGRLVLKVTGFQGPGQFPETLGHAREVAGKVMAWEAVLDKNPDDVGALLGLATHLFEVESFVESRRLLENVVAHDTERPACERKRARLYLAVITRTFDSDFARTESLLKAALAIQPADPLDVKILFWLARTYLAWEKRDQAKAVLEKIVDQFPDTPHGQKAREILREIERHQPRRH